MKNLISRLWKDESGQGMAEYGLILALIALAVIAMATELGTAISDKFEEVKNNL